MTTISVPIPTSHDEALARLVKAGFGANRSDIVRKAIANLIEEEALFSVLKAEQEVRDGKVVRGDLRKILRKLP